MKNKNETEDIRVTINNASKTKLREMALEYANEWTKELLDKGKFNEELDKIKAITKQKTNKRIVVSTRLTKAQLKLVTYNLHQQVVKDSDSDFKYQQSRNSFLANRKSYTKEMWRGVTDILGSLAEGIVEAYGSDNIVTDYETYASGKKALTEMEILETIEKTISKKKKSRKQFESQKDLVEACQKALDELREKKYK